MLIRYLRPFVALLFWHNSLAWHSRLPISALISEALLSLGVLVHSSHLPGSCIEAHLPHSVVAAALYELTILLLCSWVR